MSSQNPVFIPGPTNIPERLRHAVNAPTSDHRSTRCSRRWIDMFKRHGFDVQQLNAPWGAGMCSDIGSAQERCRDTTLALSEAA